jgi:hypothetical protein
LRSAQISRDAIGGRFTVEELPDPDRPLDLIDHNIDNRFFRESSEAGGRPIHRERQD